MKVAVVNTFDNKGGAARAAFRISEALIKSDLDCTMLVEVKSSNKAFVLENGSRFKNLFKHLIAKTLIAILNHGKVSLQSIALFSSGWPSKLNASDFSLVHMNWLNAEMMSIKDISLIEKPMIWTIHDMWPFCGATHYTFNEQWKYGYSSKQDTILQNWVWRRKVNHWKKPIHIVCPSRWLADCIKESRLMKHWPVSVIPNAIDTEFWCPKDIYQARQRLGLKKKSKVIMFGAIGSLSNHVKGFDLLIQTLQRLIQNNKDINFELLVVGEKKNTVLDEIEIPCHFTGLLSDDEMMRECYNAADIVVVPSRLEAFGQVASEAQSCGTPVAAFATSGLLDVVEHLETGYLARPYDVDELAIGIQLLLGNDRQNRQVSFEHMSAGSLIEVDASKLGHNARAHIQRLFSYEVVAQKYIALYSQVLNSVGH